MTSENLTIIWQATVLALTFFGSLGWALTLLRGRQPIGVIPVFLTSAAVTVGYMIAMQNLAYCGLPVIYSAWGVFGSALVGLALLARTFRPFWRRLTQLERRKATLALLVGIFTFAVQILPAFVTGAHHYCGNGRLDQINYIQTAQFLVDRSFYSTIHDPGVQPWMIYPIGCRWERIGQCIIQGYVAVICQTNAQAVFASVAVSSIAAASMGVFLLLRSFAVTRAYSLIGAAWFGILPMITQIHLDGFLSQTLTLPSLVFIGLSAVPREDNYRLNLVLTALTLAFTLAVYSEIYPITVAAVFMAAALNRNLSRLRSAGFALAATLASLAALPLYSCHLAAFLIGQYRAVATHPELANLTPRAGTWAGWIETFSLLPGGPGYRFAVLAGVGLFVLGLIAYDTPSRQKRFRLGALATVPCLCLLVLLSLPTLHKYPLGKLLVTFSPIFLVMMLVGVSRLWLKLRRLPRMDDGRRRPFALAAFAGLAVFVAVMVCGAAVASVRRMQRVTSGVGGAGFLRERPTALVIRDLKIKPRRSLVLDEPDRFKSAWLMYLARDSRVYLAHAPSVPEQQRAIFGRPDWLQDYDCVDGTSIRHITEPR